MTYISGEFAKEFWTIIIARVPRGELKERI